MSKSVFFGVSFSDVFKVQEFFSHRVCTCRGRRWPRWKWWSCPEKKKLFAAGDLRRFWPVVGWTWHLTDSTVSMWQSVIQLNILYLYKISNIFKYCIIMYYILLCSNVQRKNDEILNLLTNPHNFLVVTLMEVKQTKRSFSIDPQLVSQIHLFFNVFWKGLVHLSLNVRYAKKMLQWQ